MWKTVESSVRPQEVDDTSSKKYVYVNRNIEEETRTDEDGNETTVYIFEQDRISKDNRETYEACDQNAADIAYIAMMADIDL